MQLKNAIKERKMNVIIKNIAHFSDLSVLF